MRSRGCGVWGDGRGSTTLKVELVACQAVSIQALPDSLNIGFVYDPSVSSSVTNLCFYFQLGEDTVIKLQSDSTHINCDDDPLRARIRDALINTLTKF